MPRKQKERGSARMPRSQRFKRKSPPETKGRGKAASAQERRRKRVSVLRRVAACVAVLAVTFCLALLVGDEDYRATPFGWVPFIATLFAIVGAFLYLQVLKRGLRLSAKSMVGTCERAQEVKFVVEFRNRTPLMFFQLKAHFFISDLYGNPVRHLTTTMSLAPFERQEVAFAARFDHIGTYQAGLDHVDVVDFLRLFSSVVEGPAPAEVEVTPKLVPIERITLSNEAVVENAKVSKSVFADSLDYAGVREYVPGDPLKTVHWKLSSRGETYLTRLYEVYTNPGVAVIMDFFGRAETSEGLMSMFDMVVESAFSLARYAQEEGMESEIHFTNKAGEPVGLTTWRRSDLPGLVGQFPPFAGERVRESDALELLSRQIRSQYGQGNVIICTANISPEMISTIIEAKGRKREPILVAVAPARLEGRELDRWRGPLKRLDAAGIGYIEITRSEDLRGVK